MEELAKYGGWVLALIASAFGGWATLRKTKVDESGQAIQAWKEITDRHEKELEDLRFLLKQSHEETNNLRATLRRVEDECYEERKEFRREIEGLQRQIMQLHASYLAQMTILADPENPDHAKLLVRATTLLEQVSKVYSTDE